MDAQTLACVIGLSSWFILMAYSAVYSCCHPDADPPDPQDGDGGHGARIPAVVRVRAR